jgi:diguanylate cyclase (GGDEF)-like protein
MEHASTPARIAPPIERGLFAAAVREAIAAAADHEEPPRAISAAAAALYKAVSGVLPSVFVFEHGRLWLVAQRGYAVVPDGITVERGIMGRAVRLGRGQVVPDVRADPDYLEALPGIGSEVSVPLRAGRLVVGVLNLESERPFPEGVLDLIRPLASALAPQAEALRSSRTLDLPALARLFVYLGSLRDPDEIAALAAASLSRVLPLRASQVWTWDDSGSAVELAAWLSEGVEAGPLSAAELDGARAQVDPTVVCQLLDSGGTRGRAGKAHALVWLPLRVNAEEMGALIGSIGTTEAVDPAQLDTAALLAAHVAASLDAALALRRERWSAVTDSLTGILNRRGLEERLERGLATAQERRAPLSVLVFDCDDFKDINDRAGHEFGDALLREVAHVLAQSLPEGAEAARLGGDEFVVMLPGAGAEVAEALGGRIRIVLAAGLTEAGFPLRISAGISTYPFDGASSTGLLRAADQALYAAKDAGKDRVASFRHVVQREQIAPDTSPTAADDERRRGGGRRDGSVLADAIGAAKAIEAEETVDGVLGRLCKALVFVVGATACSASRVVGGYLVDATEHALREVWLGDEAAYRISDFPLTGEALRSGEPRAVSFLDGDVDPAEAFILRELGMNAMLMLPVLVRARPWGLIELYEMRLRRFSADDASIAEFLVTQAEKRLDVVASSEPSRAQPPVYELPPGAEPRRTPRTR